MRRERVWLYVLEVFGWAHFLFDRVFISGELLQFPGWSDGVLVAYDQKKQGVSEFGVARGKGEVLFEIPLHNYFHLETFIV